jgi:rhamnose transport system permease protein
MSETPNFLTGANLFNFGLNTGSIAIMALPMTLIVMVGEIDLSVASTLGLSASLLGYLFAHGWPIEGAMALVLVVGLVCGTFNGFLVTRLGLPSLAVTIGTLTLYRGIALIILGSNVITGFPTSFTNVGVNALPHTQISFTLGLFIVLAIVFGIVLHATPLGRSLYAIGLHEETAYFSGIRVKRIKQGLFALSGLICSLVGILWTFQFATASSDSGLGLELGVVTIVLFGGVSIFGGRGTIVGVVMAVCVLGGIDSTLTLVNVSAQVQNIVTGVLLLISVILPNTAASLGRLGAKFSRTRGES